MAKSQQPARLFARVMGFPPAKPDPSYRGHNSLERPVHHDYAHDAPDDTPKDGSDSDYYLGPGGYYTGPGVADGPSEADDDIPKNYYKPDLERPYGADGGFGDNYYGWRGRDAYPPHVPSPTFRECMGNCNSGRCELDYMAVKREGCCYLPGTKGVPVDNTRYNSEPRRRTLCWGDEGGQLSYAIFH